MFNLGRIYFSQNNLKEAKLWYVKAAEHEDVFAMFNLGLMLVDTSLPEARYWLEEALANGHAKAGEALGALDKRRMRWGSRRHSGSEG
jgi:TPR repeat protein